MPCALSIMSVIRKLVIMLLLILGNLGLWRTTCYAQHTSDHLKPGDQLNHTSPIICSARGSYCLQFRKIHSYSPFYYLAIYSGFLESSVWIANRNEQILNGSSEALTLDHSGVLKITHPVQEPTILYSPPADQPQDLFSNTNATLLDTGNFVLQQHHPNGSNIVLWQSFDYPTETLLPGMKLGVNHKTGKKWSLVSYSTHMSASSGSFILEWEPRTSQLIILRRGQVYWASGVLRNGKFENLSEEAQSLYNYTIVSNKDEEYFKFSPRNDATKIDKDSALWSIDPNGRLFEGSNVIARAGECYGYDSKGGCQLQNQPSCRHTGEFFDIMYVSVRGQGITYSTDDNVSLTISDCQASCWSNCHCVGFTNYNDDATGCVFYFENSQMNVHKDKILQLHFLANRSKPIDKGGPAQEPSPGQMDRYQDSNASAKRMKLLIALIIITLFIICTILWILLRRRKIMLEGKKRTNMEDEKGAKETPNDTAKLNELQNYKKDGHALKFFTYASIMEATDSFSSNNKLGQGGFGHVYQGKFHDGKEVAIKKLSRSSQQGVTEFTNELTLISELQHRNLVQLLGCCIQEEERILIYEFMQNKSLDFFLFDSTKSKLLDWKTRFNIIEGIVQGLLYLHKYSRLRVVHRDLKASNILLDENMNPKISDFGLARIITQESEGSTQRIIGTYGYMPPEYAMEGIFSVKSDVYSFGILMLEIVSGRRNNSFYNENSSLNVVRHAWELWKDGAALELVDQGIKDSLLEDQALRCIHVALLCAEERAVDRPTMAEILSMLTNQSSKLPLPKRPALCFLNNSSVNDKEITDSSYHLTSFILSLGIKVTEKKKERYCDTELLCEGSSREAARRKLTL